MHRYLMHHLILLLVLIPANLAYGNNRPRITSVAPDTPIALNGKQPFVINGKNFDPKASVTLRDRDTGEVFAERKVMRRSDSRLELKVNFTSVPARWSVEVINPDGESSGQYYFYVREPKEDSELPQVDDSSEESPAPLRNRLGWVYPLGDEAHITAHWLERGNAYIHDAEKVHLGTDFRAKPDDPVYAIGSGKVVMVYAAKDCVVVRHTAKRGEFVAVYGHVKPSVSEGDSVTAGQKIGTILPLERGSHLHFGIAWGPDAPDSDSEGRWGWGMMNERHFDNEGIPNGLVDPMAWLETQAPANKHKSESTTASPSE